MAFRFEPRETLLTGIQRISRERIASVVKLLERDSPPSGDSIHEARKHLKSIRALLRLARGAIGEETRRSENLFFRDAGRSLSEARDPQALLETLDRLEKPSHGNSGLSVPGRETTRTLLKEVRQEIEQKISDDFPQEKVLTLVAELRGAKRRTTLWFQGTLLQPANEWELLVGTGLRQTYRKARNMVSQIQAKGREAFRDDFWHELRKRAKALGYQLRLLKPIWPATMASLVDEIDQLTSLLGDANDLAVLRRKLLERDANGPNHALAEKTRRNLIRLIDRRKQALRSKALNYARVIYSEKPRQFERRLATYWDIWQPKETRGEPDTSVSTRTKSYGPSTRNIDSEALPVASSLHRVHYRT
jgi:CHAD domain-containing protein